jgi:hypothetical protein
VLAEQPQCDLRQRAERDRRGHQDDRVQIAPQFPGADPAEHGVDDQWYVTSTETQGHALQPLPGGERLARDEPDHLKLQRRGRPDTAVQREHVLAEAAVPGELALELREQLTVHVLHHGQEQIVLGREIVVDHADARARVARDAAQRRGIDSGGRETFARCFDDAGADVGSGSRHRC